MNTIELQKGKWYPIVDFPGYEINSDGQVRSFKYGAPRLSTNNNVVQMFKDRVRYTFTTKNTLLSVRLGVSPERTKNLYYIDDEAGGQFLTKDEFNKTLVSKALKERAYTSEMVERAYNETARLIELIRGYYITGNLSDLTTFLSSFEQETTAYLYKKKYVFKSEDAESCWSTALEATLLGIAERNKPVVIPSRYLKLAARNFARQTISSRRKVVSYNDEISKNEYIY